MNPTERNANTISSIAFRQTALLGDPEHAKQNYTTITGIIELRLQKVGQGQEGIQINLSLPHKLYFCFLAIESDSINQLPLIAFQRHLVVTFLEDLMDGFITISIQIALLLGSFELQ